ncbi:MAG: NUDIX hydrolase [Patescibacteria group bacterium]
MYKDRKKIKKKIVVDNKWLTVWKEAVQLPNGKVIPDYYFVKRSDVVIIVPVFNQKKVLVLRQWRPVPKNYIYNLPMGLLEKNESSPRKSAERELYEETGLLPKKMIELGKFWRAPAYLTTKVHIFLALCGHSGGPRKNNVDNSEIFEKKIFSFDEARKKITDLSSLAALLLAERIIKKLPSRRTTREGK